MTILYQPTESITVLVQVQQCSNRFNHNPIADRSTESINLIETIEHFSSPSCLTCATMKADRVPRALAQSLRKGRAGETCGEGENMI
jgi:hypothetical protein